MPIFRKMMNTEDLKNIWAKHYVEVPVLLLTMRKIGGLASTFNANIDAVLKVSPEHLLLLAKNFGGFPENFHKGPKSIASPKDLFRGFLQCFEGGVAQEWLVDDLQTFEWMKENLGHDRLQMGGQGGIIANVMSICELEKVYVHCASLPDEQARLFLPNRNLLSTDSTGQLKKASEVSRKEQALIHWILEFDGGEEIELNGKKVRCPKSNRFIATYDPLNFVLHTDDSFVNAMANPNQALDYVLLAGYQMLTHPLPDGSSGLERIDTSWKSVERWKANHPKLVVHFEFASTQDLIIRKHLLDTVAQKADSIGLNEQELLDALSVMGEKELAAECAEKLDSKKLFCALLKLFEYTAAPRIQLHMYGLYLTLLHPKHATTPEKARDGMALAATLAAGKAGTGSLENVNNLLWAHGQKVADRSLAELDSLARHLEEHYSATSFRETGIFRGKDFTAVALPTILVEQPVTLVGMGDTISSLSLTGAH